MKLEAKARLQADIMSRESSGSDTKVHGPVELHYGSGQVEKFESAKAFDSWARNAGAQMRTRVGHYEVMFFPKEAAVARIYDGVIPLSLSTKDKHFRYYAADQRGRLKRAMLFLQNTHHPLTGNVKKDYDENMAFLNEHDKPLFARRSQNWFNKLDHVAKAEYTKKYPGTKFRAKQRLTCP
jgi:hypothetical protein